MKARDFNPSSLAVAAFAADGGRLDGHLELAALPRLAEEARPAEASGDRFDWSIEGEMRAQRAEPAQVWLHLCARGAVRLVCQRCLEGLEVPLEVDRWARFVHGETQAVELDAESEDDVLALSRSFDALEWLEDEFLLALPASARHEVCPVDLPLPASAPADEVPAERVNPFKSLGILKSGT